MYLDLDLQGHFGHFDLKFLEIWLVSVITCNRFELESQNLHQTCILGFSQLVLKMEVIDLDLKGLAIISTQETAFNVALAYWSRPAKGCYTSQTCSCKIMMTSSNGNISALLELCAVNSPITGEFPAQRSSNAELWCFLWSAPWINGWGINREAGDLRRHRAHYDVIVMIMSLLASSPPWGKAIVLFSCLFET